MRLQLPLGVTVVDAWSNLMARKLRSALALLGIMIGTASLVSLLILGELAIHSVIDKIQSLGTNLTQVSLSSPPNPTSTEALTLDDMARLQHTLPSIERITPLGYLNGQISWRDHPIVANIVTSDGSLASLAQLKMQAGRALMPIDLGHNHCIIGESIAASLKSQGMIGVVGRHLVINNQYLTIVGVIAPTTTQFLIPVDFNRSVIVPYQSPILLEYPAPITQMIVQFSDNYSLKSVQQGLETQLRMRLDDDVRIHFFNPSRIIETIREQRHNLELFLTLVGIIALIVGGIGIMNVMLVSVMERRREIGIRLAIGATATSIRLMFLTEAILLSLCGGMLGILVSLIVTATVAAVVKWTFFIPFYPLAFGCLIATVTGIFFGYYPAHTASKLQPVDALRDD